MTIVMHLWFVVETCNRRIGNTGCVKSSQPTLTRYNFDKGGLVFTIFFTVNFRKDLRGRCN